MCPLELPLPQPSAQAVVAAARACLPHPPLAHRTPSLSHPALNAMPPLPEPPPLQSVKLAPPPVPPPVPPPPVTTLPRLRPLVPLATPALPSRHNARVTLPAPASTQPPRLARAQPPHNPPGEELVPFHPPALSQPLPAPQATTVPPPLLAHPLADPPPLRPHPPARLTWLLTTVAASPAAVSPTACGTVLRTTGRTRRRPTATCSRSRARLLCALRLLSAPLSLLA